MLVDRFSIAQLDPAALVFAILACLAVIFAAGSPRRLMRPPVALGMFSLAMVVLGPISYFCTRVFFKDYWVPINTALWYAGVGICCSAIGIRCVYLAPERRAALSSWQWDVRLLDVVLWIAVIVTIGGTLMTIARIGYIPIARGDISEERLTYANTGGIFYRLSLLGVSAAILGGIRWLAFGRSAASIVTIAVGLVCSSLYGPRFFPFLAIGVLLTLLDTFVRRLRVAHIILLAIPLFALSTVGAVRREAVGTFAFDRPDLRLDPSLVAIAAGYFAFNEFREFAWSLKYYDNPDHRYGGRTMIGAVIAPIPARIWSVVGVDKEKVFDFNSASAMQEVLKDRAGIRPGLLGELYMNFGLPGIAVGMFMFGAMMAWFDRGLRRTGIREPIAPVWALASLAAVFGMVGIVNMFMSTVVFYCFPIALAAFFASRRVAYPVLPAPSAET